MAVPAPPVASIVPAFCVTLTVPPLIPTSPPEIRLDDAALSMVTVRPTLMALPNAAPALIILKFVMVKSEFAPGAKMARPFTPVASTVPLLLMVLLSPK